MKILVLTSEPITGQQLRDALSTEVDPRQAEVMVVAPALQDGPIKFWFSDADDAIAQAEEVRRQSIQQLGESGVAASSDTGDSDPLKAIEDALATFPAERIVLFTHRAGDQQFREHIDEREMQERFGLPVDRATVPGSAG